MFRVRHLFLIFGPLLQVAAGCGQDWDALKAQSPVLPEGQWELTFQEECSGGAVDAKKWNRRYVAPDRTTFFDRYEWSGSSVDSANVLLADGLCKIRAENRPSGDARYTSGTLDSTNFFEQQRGYFEVRARAAAGIGFVSNINLASPVKWPPQVSLLTIEGHVPTSQRFAAYYRPQPTDSASDTDAVLTGVDFTADFHTFGLLWDDAKLIPYVDGKAVGDLGEVLPYIQEPLRLQASLQVATQYVPAPDATTQFPATLEIDYIRVYRRR